MKRTWRGARLLGSADAMLRMIKLLHDSGITLVLVDGDPTRRIGDIRNTDLVVKDGKIYEVPALHRSIGVLPR